MQRLLQRLVLAGMFSLAATTVSADDITTTPWADLLREFNDDGHVNYQGLVKQPRLLTETLAELESARLAEFQRRPAAARMAFWINAYNAYTLRWIVDHYPTDGILETVSLWRRALGAPFNREFIPLGHLLGAGSDPLISLASIEHEILRKEFDDPRIHFAIVCASKSCPKLRSEPYSGDDLDRQLDENAREFMGDRAKNRYETRDHRLVASKIFRWFADDFAAGGGPRGYFMRYGPRQEAAALAAAAGRLTVEFANYDWSLND